MARVPDTNTFSLQDVVNVVNPATGDLISCNNNSIAEYFDARYSGDKNSLYNFRNYGFDPVSSTSTTTTTSTTSTSTSTTTLQPLDFAINSSCTYYPDTLTISTSSYVGGSGVYYAGTSIFNSESEALSNTNWILVNGFGAGITPANGTYWAVVKDSVGNIKAKSVVVSCFPAPSTSTSTTTSTTTTTQPPTAPFINSITFPAKTFNSVTVESNVSSDGGSPITERGICYNLTGNPTINDNKVLMSNVVGLLSVDVTGLAPNTGYYFCAYAVNSVGITYYCYPFEIYTDAIVTTSTSTSTTTTTQAPTTTSTTTSTTSTTTSTTSTTTTTESTLMYPWYQVFESISGYCGEVPYTYTMPGLEASQYACYSYNTCGYDSFEGFKFRVKNLVVGAQLYSYSFEGVPYSSPTNYGYYFMTDSTGAVSYIISFTSDGIIQSITTSCPQPTTTTTTSTTTTTAAPNATARLWTVTIPTNVTRLNVTVLYTNNSGVDKNMKIRVMNNTQGSSWVEGIVHSIFNGDTNVSYLDVLNMGVSNFAGDSFSIELSLDGGSTWTGTIYHSNPLTLPYDESA
jgi:hypothetical protein